MFYQFVVLEMHLNMLTADTHMRFDIKVESWVSLFNRNEKKSQFLISVVWRDISIVRSIAVLNLLFQWTYICNLLFQLADESSLPVDNLSLKVDHDSKKQDSESITECRVRVDAAMIKAKAKIKQSSNNGTQSSGSCL